MNGLVFHIVSGDAFLTGVALMVIAAGASCFSRWWSKHVVRWGFAVGAMAIAISSTPLSVRDYALAVLATLLWLTAVWLEKRIGLFAGLVIAVWLAGLAMEISWRFPRSPTPVRERSLAVIGDSVSAGMGENEAVTWPRLLADTHQLDVQDLSHVGETAGSALKRVRETPIRAPVVLVEIGGNDLLGSTTARQFDVDLDALLEQACASDRQVILFELPLPPFCQEFGRIQRRLARKYGVVLIPRRNFLSVLASGGATLDSIHLSQDGHEQMAEMVWSIVRPAYPSIHP